MADNLAYKSGDSWAYDNEESNVYKYGRLYDWETAKTVCPSDWHLPSDNEWMQLINYLGGDSIAGGKLKSISDWVSPNTRASNESGFSAIAGGGLIEGSFNYVGLLGGFWSSTQMDATGAWYRFLSNDKANAGQYHLGKKYGISVRCMRD